jgi:hypothetical protein
METPTQAASEQQPVAAAAAAAPEPEIEIEGTGPSQESEEGEQKQEPVAAVAPGAAREPVNVKIPEFIPQKEMNEERAGWVTGFEGAASQSGIKAEGAQRLVDAFTDVATAIPYTIEHAHATPEDAAMEMERAYGAEQADALVRGAQRFWAKLPGPMQNYLNETGLGNDPGVLTTLALAEAGIFRHSPEQAQKEIDRITKSEEFSSDDPKLRLLNVVKVQILSRIANRDVKGPQEKLAQAAKRPDPRYVDNSKQSTASREAARSEAAEMMKPGTALMDAKHLDHAAAVAKWHALIARTG